MKKFMAFVLAVLVTGCAGLDKQGGNPYARDAGTTVATVIPAALCYQQWGWLGALTCGAVGNQLSKAVQYDSSAQPAKVVHVYSTQPGGYYSQGWGGNAVQGVWLNACGQSVYCDKTASSEHMDPPGPGKCRVSGVILEHDLIEQTCNKIAFQKKMHGGQAQQAVAQPSRWDRNNLFAEEKPTEKPVASEGAITLENYLKEGKIPEGCQKHKKNLPLVRACVKERVVEFDKFQESCEKGSTHPHCKENLLEMSLRLRQFAKLLDQELAKYGK